MGGWSYRKVWFQRVERGGVIAKARCRFSERATDVLGFNGFKFNSLCVEVGMTRTLIPAVVVASTIGAVVGVLVSGNVLTQTNITSRFFDQRPLRSGGDAKGDQADLSFDQTLVRISSELNKSLPAMMDRETRLDSTLAGPGKRLTYFYTLVNYSRGDLDTSQVQQVLRPRLLANYKSNEQMKDLRDGNVELHYQYKGKGGEFLFELVVAPRDF